MCVCAGKNSQLGDEGGQALLKALETNATVTSINLGIPYDGDPNISLIYQKLAINKDPAQVPIPMH